jgi:hypothetical protein
MKWGTNTGNLASDANRETASRLAIIQAVNGVGFHADEKDWASCRALLAAVVELDYSSLIGGEPATVEASQVIANWKAVLDPVHATQHLITNHLVNFITSSEATCLSHVQASHWHPGAAGGEKWLLWGSYRHKLVRIDSVWLICAMKLTVKWQEGNKNLIQDAALR